MAKKRGNDAERAIFFAFAQKIGKQPLGSCEFWETTGNKKGSLLVVSVSRKVRHFRDADTMQVLRMFFPNAKELVGSGTISLGRFTSFEDLQSSLAKLRELCSSAISMFAEAMTEEIKKREVQKGEEKTLKPLLEYGAKLKVVTKSGAIYELAVTPGENKNMFAVTKIYPRYDYLGLNQIDLVKKGEQMFGTHFRSSRVQTIDYDISQQKKGR